MFEKSKRKIVKWSAFFLVLMAALLVPSMQAEAKCANGKHTWGSWEVKKAATYNHTGTKTRSCNKCSAKQTRDIAKKSMDSKQEAVYTAFKNYIRAARNYDVGKIAKCFESPKKAKSELVGWSYLETKYKKYNKNITYDVARISVNGKKATVKAKITTASMYSTIAYALDDSFIYAFDYYFDHGKMPSDSQLGKYYKRRIQYWYKTLGVDTKEDTRTVTFTYVKTNGKWKIKSPTTSILDVALMRYEKAFKDVCDNYGI